MSPGVATDDCDTPAQPSTGVWSTAWPDKMTSSTSVPPMPFGVFAVAVGKVRSTMKSAVGTIPWAEVLPIKSSAQTLNR